MKRKILSLLLCFAMLFLLMPTMAFAAEDEEDTDYLVTIKLIDVSETGVAGAALTLYGTTISGAELEPYSWTSTGADMKFELSPGTYKLEADTAPAGYIKPESISFTVGSDGTITINYETVAEVSLIFDTCEHQWDEGTITSSVTCTENGVKTFTCTVCGETKTEEIEALGHTEVVDEAVKATCTETGLTAGAYCSVCGEILVAREEVPALGHTEVVDEAVEATCTETGLTAGSHCSVCDETLVAQEEVPALGHTEVVDGAVEATCTDTGLTACVYCSVCGEILVAQEEVPALGHTEVVDEAVEATCTDTGLTACVYCSVCGEILDAQEEVPALGHTEVVDEAVEATCTETGLTAGSHCSVCDETLVAQEEVPALGHTEVVDEAVEATCTATGLTEGKHCTVCGEVLVAQIVTEKIAHTYSGNKCTVCGYTKPSSGGSSSGSSAPATYAVKASDSDHGSVTVSPKSASAGDTVKVTVNPDKGYTLETITVTDKNGKEVALAATEIGKAYTFKMPSGAVTVKATFMDDNTMLNYFVDVTASDYYYDAVLWASENGITDGVDAVHFAPNSTCTRAQAVTFLWRAAGCPEPESAGSFADVNADAYYTKAVAWAAEQGITGGTTATTFSPNATCTRAQIMTFLYRFNGVDTMEIKDNPFTDVAEGLYYYDAVLWGAKNGITGGTTATTFSPDATCTRAQIVTFLYRFINK